jgi:transcriptional regulator with XRE-family HTH domain
MYTQAELTALDSKEYRDAYVDEHVRTTVAYQLRSIRERLGLTQKQFANVLDRPASVISRLENTEYGKVTVQTLLDIARRLDVSLIVKFASFPEFLSAYGDISAEALAVDDYESTKEKESVVSPIGNHVPTSPHISYTAVSTSGTTHLAYGEVVHHHIATITNDRGVIALGLAAKPYALIHIATVPGERQNG